MLENSRCVDHHLEDLASGLRGLLQSLAEPEPQVAVHLGQSEMEGPVEVLVVAEAVVEVEDNAHMERSLVVGIPAAEGSRKRVVARDWETAREAARAHRIASSEAARHCGIGHRQANEGRWERQAHDHHQPRRLRKQARMRLAMTLDETDTVD